MALLTLFSGVRQSDSSTRLTGLWKLPQKGGALAEAVGEVERLRLVHFWALVDSSTLLLHTVSVIGVPRRQLCLPRLCWKVGVVSPTLLGALLHAVRLPFITLRWPLFP